MGSQTGNMPQATDGDLLSLAQTLLETVKGHVDDDKGSKADITALAKKILSATTGPEELIGGYATSVRRLRNIDSDFDGRQLTPRADGRDRCMQSVYGVEAFRQNPRRRVHFL